MDWLIANIPSMRLELMERCARVFVKCGLLPSVFTSVAEINRPAAGTLPEMLSYRFSMTAGAWMEPLVQTPPDPMRDWLVGGVHGSSFAGAMGILQSRVLKGSRGLPDGVYLAGVLNPRNVDDYVEAYRKMGKLGKDTSGFAFELEVWGQRKRKDTSDPLYIATGGGTNWEQACCRQGFITTFQGTSYTRWAAPPSLMKLRALWVADRSELDVQHEPEFEV